MHGDAFGGICGLQHLGKVGMRCWLVGMACRSELRTSADITHAIVNEAGTYLTAKAVGQRAVVGMVDMPQVLCVARVSEDTVQSCGPNIHHGGEKPQRFDDYLGSVKVRVI